MSRDRYILLAVLFCSAAAILSTHGQTITFIPSSQPVSSSFASVSVVDINGDGWLETLGTLNDKSGNLISLLPSDIGLDEIFVPGRPNDIRVADFNGDGCPDLIIEGYSSTHDDTRALLYFNDCDGRFKQDSSFAELNYRGRGEGLVLADFNNDGYLDIFLPYYTFQPCTDAFCPNSAQSYLLLNDGRGHFRDVAKPAGVHFSTS